MPAGVGICDLFGVQVVRSLWINGDKAVNLQFVDSTNCWAYAQWIPQYLVPMPHYPHRWARTRKTGEMSVVVLFDPLCAGFPGFDYE